MPRRKRKSKWKWVLIGSLVPLVVATAGLTAFLLRPRERITWDNFENLRPGMSRAEAEALLGPAKRYVPNPKHPDIEAVPWASRCRKGPIDNTTLIRPTDVWEGNILTIWGVFDSDGTLDFFTASPTDEDKYEYVPEHVKREMFRFAHPR
jgi:hypothetical protein